MAQEHSSFRTTADSVKDAARIISRFDGKDSDYVFTLDDLHAMRCATTMLFQAARSAAELSGLLDNKLRGDK